MGHDWRSYPDPKAAAEACAAYVAGKLGEALGAGAYASLAVSGGTSPKLMFARLAEAPLAWDRIHIFWVDERAVPPDDPESNYKLADEWLLARVSIPPRNVHRIRAELAPGAAAAAYAQEIREFFGIARREMPEFDVVHRGMGPDAHTASLFPGEPLIEAGEGIAAAVYVEKKKQWRITLLPGALARARATVMLVTGEDKAAPLRAVFEDAYDPKRLPAQLAASNAVWFLDTAAARLIA